MRQVFVELYNYRPAWHALPTEQKEAFAKGVLNAVEEAGRHELEVVGWGMNDPNTDRRAAYDFFCIYRVPSVQFQRGFEASIAGSGWYNYFEQVNVSGAIVSPADLLKANITIETPKAQAI